MLNTTVRAISVEAAAVQLGLGRTAAYALVKSGRLRHVRVGMRILIPVRALEEFLAGDPVDSGAPA